LKDGFALTLTVDGDGLKWFNWLYYRVTQAVAQRIATGGFRDPVWMADLDVKFARFYFDALLCALQGDAVPDCWEALLSRRGQMAIARIQFALAGINAHINHDLPQAIVIAGGAEQEHYGDYTGLNSTLDGLIELAKQTLLVRLLGEPLPVVSHLEDTIGAWSVGAARQAAWQNAEILEHLGNCPPLSENFLQNLDGLTAVVSKTLLTPVP
jgi:hypothetical protein